MQRAASSAIISKRDVSWTVLRLRRPLARRHMLVLNRFEDLRRLMFGHWEMFEYVLFAFDKQHKPEIDPDTYMTQIIKCCDEMSQLRLNLKLAFKTSTLGHVYVINECIPMYAFLNEWYVQNYLELYQLGQETFTWEIPHVVVFDLDSTLITDELDVRIRDPDVYSSLLDLKQRGCVLMLWSYGNEDHVSHSLKVTKLTNFFDTIICEGYKTGESCNRVIVDAKHDTVLVKKSFYLDVEEDDKRLPKSPRVVLFYLRKLGVNYYKTLTLVDDLKTNNYSYDYFINVKKCPEPRNDWQQYHEIIVDNMEQHDREFSQW
ncbi:38K [Orgyia leucostigma nucleopolyhedrovirus]|uniref:38K n=1 Tax=Orgyia leucostigma nucleopolyhedrovirus TaxID=490711 RepID=B0FDV3_9ABAC|nr:38K [Orgyia leucostigma nucleopolyhedrovirus]ABY65811.1 38K [Orgyia leucostigma nucleopolyhedrovirus]